MESKAVELKV